MSAPNRVAFTGSLGSTLAARLDLPPGPPRAYALFAHCFTCSKDVFAAARVSAGLAAHGIAVLRFDFTGLGHSDGEFASTNFSSNVADLLRAADYLRENHEAPRILVGHSLGGAAVLAAAGSVPEAVAVATIGAPCDAAHVAERFTDNLAEIEAKGAVEVKLGGRPFSITQQFLDDIQNQNQVAAIGKLGKALLVMHGPHDKVVGISNAAEIFAAAKHPKSFVSLDDADHLLTRREDAAYAADVISAWSSRFVPQGEEPRAEGSANEVVVSEAGDGKFAQQIWVGGRHALRADEPPNVGGGNTGPTPYDFLLAGLGACTTMTLRIYADRKGLPLDRARVTLRHNKVHAEDCAACETQGGKIDRIERVLVLEGALDAEQRASLLAIAEKCPVHRTLHSEVVVDTTLEEGGDR